MDNKRFVGHNQRDLKSTRAYNAARIDGDKPPKLHSVPKQQNLVDEHAELRVADVAASAYANSLTESEQYDATQALKGVDYIGIFQPCCVLCAACFAASGAANKTRGYHTKNVTTWTWPPFILADKNAITAILGVKAMHAIGESASSLALMLRTVTTSHSGWDSYF